jgi:hypothetical protein
VFAEIDGGFAWVVLESELHAELILSNRKTSQIAGDLILPFETKKRTGRPTSDRTTTIGCPIFATVSSSRRWAIFAAKIPIL